MPGDSQALTVRDLRRRWKPHKERLQAARDNHPTAIRFHRACSWLSRVEELDAEVDADLVLINQWVGFNALYGRWDVTRREPLPDRECWKEFVDRLIALDDDELIVGVLQQDKRLVMSILEDEYLSGFFWEEPNQERKGKARRTKFKAQSWYVEKSWKIILDNLLDRIYLLRCQLMHGAATCGGKLNRRPLRRCNTMLTHLLIAWMLVFIENGSDEDWGALCYPPLRSVPSAVP